MKAAAKDLTNCSSSIPVLGPGSGALRAFEGDTT